LQGAPGKRLHMWVLDGSCVTYGCNSKLSKDTLNGNDIENRFPVIKLLYHLRANRFQPAYQKIIIIITITAIISIVGTMINNEYN
jgi:hypothetical protein